MYYYYYYTVHYANHQLLFIYKHTECQEKIIGYFLYVFAYYYA